MYDEKYSKKEETSPRSIVVYFIDNFLIPGQSCLDLGCGAGRHSKYLAEKGIDVTAVDLSQEGVRKTQQILADYPRSDALVADIHHLPFSDASFDSLISNRVLDYNDDHGLDTVFSEIVRVVKENTLILLTLRSTAQLPKQNETLTQENDLGGKTYQVQGGKEVGVYQHYFTESEIRRLAEDHGLTVEEIKEDQSENKYHDLKAEWQVILKKNSEK